MAKVEIELNKAGLEELMKSDEILDNLTEIAQQVCDIANSECEGFEISQYQHGKTRANVSVGASTQKAFYHNMKHNTLLKASGSAT